MNLQDVYARINSVAGAIRKQQAENAKLAGKFQLIERLLAGARSITEEIDSIPGRRIFYNLNGQQTFTTADAGRRGEPINFLISQDGPYVMTHYPMVVWRPSQPAGATNFGVWRPPASAWPLATQEVGEDRISISWELVDGGSQRNFQNLPTPPGFSRPDNMVPLSVPTLFTPNTVIQFFPTYQSIVFNAAVPPTEGTLEVQLAGYRIVNM